MNTEAIFSQDGITAVSSQIQQLKTLFPACFDKDGRFLIDKFQAEIAQQTDISREFYAMNWLGKSYARLLRNLPPETLLSEDKTHNAKPENADSQNLLIRGDNLEVLKHLKNAYTSSVKMIYIDPPYNTGSDGFVYQDDRKFTPTELARLANIDEDEAARILDFTDKDSNSHSAWLTFMYPRLYVARELLKDDGVIFISIDDNEAAQLKLLCDEVFGEGNFVSQVIRRSKVGGGSDNKQFATEADYLFVYAKNKHLLKTFNTEHTEIDLKRYKEEDEEGLFFWDTYSRSGLVTGDDDSLFYEVEFPDGTFREERWRRSKDRLLDDLSKNEAKFVKTKNGWNIHFKQRLSDGKRPRQILFDGFGNTKGTSEIVELFGDKNIFKYPKPVDFIKFLISIALDKTEFVLDFFAGSGSTAQAIMKLNLEQEDSNRNFILVQIPEFTDKKNAAHKAGYPTIFDITKARIEKATAKIRAEHPDYTGDLGFKIFQTVEHFRQHPDNDFSPEQPDLPLNDELGKEQLQTLLTTWTLYDGAALTTPVVPVRLGSYTAYLCEKRLYLMNAGFTSADLLAFIKKLDDDADFNPNRVIVFGSNMASAMQHELDQAVRGYTNKKEIELNVIIRV